MNFLKFWTTFVYLFERKVTLKIIRNLKILSYRVGLFTIRGKLQVRKANNVSWKINNKSPYGPSDPIRHK